MSEATASLRRIVLIADVTLRESVRQRVFLGLLLSSVLLVAGARWLGDFNFGAPELRFIANLGFGAIGALGAVLAVVATSELFLGEIERGSVQMLLVRPLRREEFVLGKFVGAVAVVTAYWLVLAALLLLVIWSRERELARSFGLMRGVSYEHLVIMGWLLWLKLCVACSLALAVASYARTQVFAVSTTMTIYMICHFHSLVHGVGKSLLGLLPNLGLLDESIGSGSLVWAIPYAVGWCMVACGVAMVCFRSREF